MNVVPWILALIATTSLSVATVALHRSSAHDRIRVVARRAEGPVGALTAKFPLDLTTTSAIDANDLRVLNSASGDLLALAAQLEGESRARLIRIGVSLRGEARAMYTMTLLLLDRKRVNQGSAIATVHDDYETLRTRDPTLPPWATATSGVELIAANNNLHALERGQPEPNGVSSISAN